MRRIFSDSSTRCSLLCDDVPFLVLFKEICQLCLPVGHKPRLLLVLGISSSKTNQLAFLLVNLEIGTFSCLALKLSLVVDATRETVWKISRSSTEIDSLYPSVTTAEAPLEAQT